jgi:hypothetical protein
MKRIHDIKTMRNIPTSIENKLFSMPDAKNYQKKYLELYVLAKEKSRTEKELDMLEDKRTIILKKILLLEAKMADCKEHLDASGACHRVNPNFRSPMNLKEIFLEY